MVLSEADFEPRRRRAEDQSHVQWMTPTSQVQLTLAIPRPLNDYNDQVANFMRPETRKRLVWRRCSLIY